MSDTYAAKARQHAPRTLEETRTAVQRLLDQGHSDYGIAAILGCSVEQVRRLVGCEACCG